jgi:hypothetical protein
VSSHIWPTVAALAALYAARRFYRNWGTPKDECRMHLPGDELIADPTTQTTDAVSIARCPEGVWPWLVQMGQDRGGLYIHEVLGNLIGLQYRNADRIHSEWQDVHSGSEIRIAPRGWLGLPNGVTSTVEELLAERAMVLRGSYPGLPFNLIWSFHLLPRGDDQCRLLVRTRTGLRHPGEVFLTEAAGPLIAFMTRAMLLGIRKRAEATGLGAAGLPPAVESNGKENLTCAQKP